VEQLELEKIGFEIAPLKTECRPAFNPKVYLKLYFYGYLNGLRSSRKLEKEAIRNVELDWLLEGLAPNYHRISEKKNSKLDFKLFRVRTVF
jgi:transposase